MKKLLLVCLLLASKSWVSAQTPPSITSQSPSQTVAFGTNLTLSVAASGSTPLSYQWHYNGSDLVGATNSSYNISFFQVPDIGSFSVTVTNQYGATNSSNIVLGVTPSCAPVDSGLKAWYQGENNALDLAGGFDGGVHSITYAAGEVNNCFVLNGTNAYVGLGTSVGLFGTNDFSVEFWEKTTNIQGCFIGNNPPTSSGQYWQVGVIYPSGLYFYLGNDSQGSFLISSATNVENNAWHHIACTRSNAGGGSVIVSIYVDGTLITNATTFVISPNQGTYGLKIGYDQYAGSYFNGSMDEVALYSRALSSSEIASIYAAGSIGKCCADVSITGQPKSPKNLTSSVNALFSVTNLGTAPYYYQWYHSTNASSTITLANGANAWGSTISGATSSSLTIAHPLATNDLGTYNVVLWNDCTLVQSQDVYLDFVPSITTQPHSCTASIGQANTNFTVVSSGSPLAYKWRGTGGVALNDPAKYGSSTNTASLTIYNIEGSDSGSYSVVITNHGGTVTSTTVTLSTPPQITVQPTDKINSCGASSTFTVTATGTATLTYQWQSNTVNDSTFHDIIGATSKNLTVSPIDATWSTNGYQCVINNSFGSTTSSVAHLYVKATVSVGPGSGNICDGNPVTLSLIPCTTDVTSYQWRRNGINISGATASTYTTATAGSYTVVITNNWGNDTSSPSAILKSVASPTITLAPQSQTVLLGNPAYFVANVTGTSPFTYSWIQDSTNVLATGVTNYTIASVVATNAGSYVFQATNDCGTANSTPPALLTVVSTPQCATNFVDSSLLDWWKFESNLVDSVSTNDGTGSGLTYAAGEVNTGIQFDGTTNATLTCSTNAGNFGTNDFTIEFWMKTSATNDMSFMEKDAGCLYVGSGWAFRISIDTDGKLGHTSFECWSGSTVFGGTEHTYVLCDGQWHHLAVTRTGLYISMYVDGAFQPDASGRLSSSINVNNNTALKMGRTACEGSWEYPYNGMLDEVSFYNRALSAGEINTIYNAQSQGKCGP